MLSRRTLLLAAACTLALPRVARADDPVGDLLARIARARAGLRTLRGPFTQTRTIGLLATDVRSTGALALVRPDRLRWELAPPDEVTFFVGPEGLAYRSAHGKGSIPAASTKFAGALDDLRTLLAGDLARLRDRWVVRISRDDATGAELTATPLPGVAGPVHGFDLALGPDLVRPTRVTLTLGPRDKTVIDFGTLAVNGPVDPSTMRP